jgi:hypothetical protein
VRIRTESVRLALGVALFMTYASISLGASAVEKLCTQPLSGERKQFQGITQAIESGKPSHIFNGLGRLVDGHELHRGVALRVSPNYVLTAAHVAPLPQVLDDWYVEFIDLDSIRSLKKFRLSSLGSVIGHKGHLDYALIALQSVHQEIYPSKGATRPRISAGAIVSSARKVHLVKWNTAVDTSEASEAFGVIEAQEVCGVHRFLKSAGTSMVLDYLIHTYAGSSGGALYDENYRWIGIHNRRLYSATEENGSCWHPYFLRHYGGRIDTSTPQGPVELCAPKPILEGIVLDIGQGTLLFDIANDVLSRRGKNWMLVNATALWEVLFGEVINR